MHLDDDTEALPPSPTSTYWVARELIERQRIRRAAVTRTLPVLALVAAALAATFHFLLSVP